MTEFLNSYEHFHHTINKSLEIFSTQLSLEFLVESYPKGNKDV